ncbi:MAG TPA: proton-conducting transporter membrane subunit [Streptosporangiaceae bacterium]|jgi:hydrogenase-4 component F|nr:proton-conducting transporter membrane subunit [Streptosporangiaceae bacterium]
MTALAILIALGPLAGPTAAIAGARARLAGIAQAAGALVAFGCALALLAELDGHPPLAGWDGFLYVDPLGGFFAMTVAGVTLLAALGSIGYVCAEEDSGAFGGFQVRLYYVFFGLFASLMLAALETGNLGLLFVLVEASTLASAALVGIEGRSRSLEAAWKYVIISSLGVTIALAGTLFLFYSGSALHLGSNLGLTWPYLFLHAHALAPQPLRLAFLLAVVGYGTKVGLAPMHTWLPDAHAEAPSPASAMLSAALLNTGMYAIIRFLAIAHARLGGTYPRAVLLSFGFASIVIGALFMVRRGNFKRLFAYSSVEHMGIIAVALGFGGTLGLYGALLQMLNHALAKSVLFLSSGDVSLRYKTREASQVSGLLAAVPVTGGALLLASFAVLGSPPFGLFLSELTIVRAGFASASPVFPLLLLFLLGLAFVAFARTTAGMVTGRPPDQLASPYRGKAAAVSTVAPLVLGLAALLVLGLWIPVGLDTVLRHSIAVIG